LIICSSFMFVCIDWLHKYLGREVLGFSKALFSKSKAFLKNFNVNKACAVKFWNSLNNHLLQQSHLDACFWIINYLTRRYILLLATIYQMLSSSSINISQYLFVQLSAPKYANEHLVNIPVCRWNRVWRLILQDCYSSYQLNQMSDSC
jgi:hypothetical protein